MTTNPRLTTPDGRQIAKTIWFPADHVRYINWTKIGEEREELACHMEVYRHESGGLTVTLFWMEE